MNNFRQYFTILYVLFTLLGTLKAADEYVDITSDGNSIVVRDINVNLNCCSKISDEIIISGKKIQIIQTDTSTTKCKCECLFDLIHTIYNPEIGKYRLEVYREELRKFGYPEDRKYLVFSGDYNFQSEFRNKSLYYDFRQTACKTPSKVTSNINFNKTSLEAFPNPSKGELNIRFNTKSDNRVKFVLYNFIGKEVFSTSERLMQEGLQTWSMDIPNLPSGMYIGKLIYDDGATSTIKIVWSK